MILPVKPLMNISDQILKFPQSNFGHKRKYDFHTGIDIYVEDKSLVKTIDSGIVYQMGVFTGALAESPWWNYTEYVVIKTNQVFWLYGEIINSKDLFIGKKLKKGDYIGNVTPVLHSHKTANPTSMLHLEAYSHYSHPITWNLESPQVPHGLLNPVSLILELT